MKLLTLTSIVPTVFLCAGLSLLGCGNSDGTSPNQGKGGATQNKTGGSTQPGQGGNTQVSQGGTTGSSTGGSTVTPNTGGQPGLGGTAAGGVAAKGGAQETGGSSGGSTTSSGGQVTGGTSASGGTPTSTGGAIGTAGVTANGGATSEGGAKTGGSTNVPKSCMGWASVNADGVNGTTGGGNGPVVEITSAEQMTAYYKSSGVYNTEPMTLRIMNDITGEIKLSSNKTVEGANKNITIHGGLVFSGKGGMFSNLIIRNLRINGLKSPEDGIDIRMAHHVCIEYCEIFDGPDGNLDIVNQGNYITVAYTKFYYTSAYKPLPSETESQNHRYSNLIGNSDGATTDLGKLKVTYHHNWWGDLVIERMPRMRFGEIHVFNNYYSSKGNNYCIGAGEQAKVLVENNYFENVNNPHIFHEGKKTAQIVAKGNEYINVTGLRDVGQGDAFVPPYDYNLESAATAKATVMAHAGPQ